MANGQNFTLNFNALLDTGAIKGSISEIQNALKSLRLPDNLEKGLKDSFTKVEKALTDFENRAAKGIKTKADAKGISDSMNKIIIEFSRLETAVDKVKKDLNGADLSKIIKLNDADLEQLRKYKTQIEDIQKQLSSINSGKLTELQNALNQIKSGSGAQKRGAEALQLFKDGDIQGAIQHLNAIISKLESLRTAANAAGKDTTNLGNSIEQLGAMRATMQNAQRESADLITQQNQVTADSANYLAQAQQKVVDTTHNAVNTTHQLSDTVQQASGSVIDFASNQARLNTELDQVKSRIQYFLGIANAVRLVRQAVRSAFNTVKDLDKAMTETAVVTEHTISDMWAKLPEYTKRANQLGVSTLDAYKSATLYYQQGLNDDQAAALSTETLKMARIAGLEAAEATDRMTNALRGFNMELNALNAQRVDDVYSQLAAHSASNVDEISTAMTKVASLAHNANMEFETTAAFLAQIIETTRESAETAGTALKTVVARFSEVKKLVDENQLKGSDEEGQVIDVNKVSAALRTAGIDLNKYFIGEVGLDDIFMELASKWDSLTAVQQRYIATQAAGSRQQSRFIALMQDYARTQELVGMAYDSTGASEKQFEKTQDSLQSKLARLKNAWNEFLMGIANSGIIKGAVDTLTLLLNVINKLTGAFGKGASGILKFAAGAAAFAGLKSLFKNGGIAEKALGSLGNTGVGRFLGLGGNTSGQITSAGATFNAQVVSAGAQFAAAVRGAAGAEAVTGGAGGAGGVGLRLTPWQAIQQFKANSLRPNANADAYNAYAQMAQEYMALNPGKANPYAAEMAYYNAAVPKTLFGALGNRFLDTGVGKATAGALGKLGFGGAAGAAGVSGAAALAATIGTITVAAGAAAVAIKKIYDLSPAGQVKIAEKYAKVMSEISDNTKKTADSYKSAQEKLKEYDDTLSEASTASKRSDIIKERNDYIMQQMQEDSSFAKYVKSNYENGELVLTLDEESFAEATKHAAEAAEKAAVSSDFAQAALAGRQANRYRSKFEALDWKKQQLALDGETLTAEQELLYRQYQKQADDANRQMRQYAQKAFSQLIDPQEVGDDVANLMSEALAESFQDEQIITGTGWLRSRTHWQNEYMKYYGQEADSSMKTADIYRAVQQAIKVEENQGRADKLANYIQSDNTGRTTELLRAFNGDLGNRNLLTTNINNEADLYKLFGFNLEEGGEELGQVLIDLADALGIETDELRKQLQEQVKLRKKQQGQQLYKTSAAMLGGGVSAENIVKYLRLSNTDQQQLFSKIYSSFDASYISDELVSSLLTNIEDTELTDWLSNIDLSNPITAFAELSDQAVNAKGSIQTVAQQLLQAGKDSQQFSAANQMNYLLLSSGYDSISESLGKFIEENGEISSANIQELAESSSDLNNLLKTGTMTVKGLAVALNSIETGTITMLDLSDAVLAALNSMDDLDGMVNKIIEDLNNFDAGFDENDIVGFIDKVLENANENVGKGAYGNNQMKNYMQKIFGTFEYEGAPEGYGDAYKEWLNNNIAWLEANKDNMFSAWQDFSSTLDNQMLGTAEIYEKDGEIILNANGMTTEQLIQAMVATGEVTKTQAEMMIADFKNYSADFAHEMAENDLPGAIQSWMDALPVIDGTHFYDEADISTLSKLLNVEESRIKEVIDQLKKDSEEYQGIKWTNDKGERTKESILRALGETGQEIKTISKTNQGLSLFDYDIEELFDYDKIKQAYSDLGIPQMFESDFNQILKEGDSFFASFFGKDPTKISIETGKTAGQAYAEAYQQAVNADLATQIGNTFSTIFEGLELKINVEDGALEVITKTQEAADDLGKTEAKPTIGVDDQASATLDGIITDLKTISKGAKATITVDGDIPDTHALGAGAKGGVVDSYGSGSNHISPGVALTGEEGPEIVWNKEKGYAYITGGQHPQFQDLKPGDRVFNAQETKKILKGSAVKGKIPSFAKGYEADGSGGGGGSSSSNKKSSSEWRNELDWLYDLMEDIAEYERQQSLIQDDYDLALKDLAKTGRDLYNLTKDELENLQSQREGQEGAQAKRLQQMLELQSEVNKAGYGKYVQYNQKDRTLEIDWDAIEAIQDKDTYDEVVDYLKRMETVQDQMDDAEQALKEIDKRIQELEERFLQKYLEFQNRVLEAVVKQYQDAIDNLSELNNKLDDTNQSILDSIQKEIDLERQIRDNTDTESNIADMEVRLAYLQRDTTGANDTEIRDLQKQLTDARENYSDTLIDQAVERLSQNNEEASEQRNRQIELMQAQLDYWQESGGLWDEVNSLIATGFDADGKIILGSELENVLRNAEDYEAMSEAQRENWANELILETNEVGAYIIKLNEGMDLNAERVRALLEEISGKIGGTPEHSIATKKDSDSGSGGGSSSSGSNNKSPSSSSTSGDDKTVKKEVSGWKSNDTKHWKIETYYDEKGNEVYSQKVFEGNHVWKDTAGTHWEGNTLHHEEVCEKCGRRRSYTTVKKSGSSGSGGGSLRGNKMAVYATGGLATQTGPAWLDGTPSEPEYVLNARQTNAFLRLAEVLPAVMNGGVPTAANYGGDIYLDLSMHVDEIASDYDVDRIADRVKEIIYDASSYRNVNTLNFIR